MATKHTERILISDYLLASLIRNLTYGFVNNGDAPSNSVRVRSQKDHLLL